jgi:hypothetical protein
MLSIHVNEATVTLADPEMLKRSIVMLVTHHCHDDKEIYCESTAMKCDNRKKTLESVKDLFIVVLR